MQTLSRQCRTQELSAEHVIRNLWIQNPDIHFHETIHLLLVASDDVLGIRGQVLLLVRGKPWERHGADVGNIAGSRNGSWQFRRHHGGHQTLQLRSGKNPVCHRLL
jgi:hypothetical protein